MFGNPPTAVDAGTGLGIRSYTGNLTTPGSADNWSGGDSTVPVDDFAPQITLILDSNGAGAPNSMKDPDGVVLDSQGNLYVAACGSGPGSGDQGVFKITPGGVVTELMDDTCCGYFREPSGLTTDAEGNLYVAGKSSDNVFMITPDGVVTEILDSSGDGMGNPLNGHSTQCRTAGRRRRRLEELPPRRPPGRRRLG